MTPGEDSPVQRPKPMKTPTQKQRGKSSTPQPPATFQLSSINLRTSSLRVYSHSLLRISPLSAFLLLFLSFSPFLSSFFFVYALSFSSFLSVLLSLFLFFLSFSLPRLFLFLSFFLPFFSSFFLSFYLSLHLFLFNFFSLHLSSSFFFPYFLCEWINKIGKILALFLLSPVSYLSSLKQHLTFLSLSQLLNRLGRSTQHK